MTTQQSLDSMLAAAAQAVSQNDWKAVERLAKRILKKDRDNVDGLFMAGLAAKATGRNSQALKPLLRALRNGPQRADVAIELAHLHVSLLRPGEAYELLQQYASAIGDKPRFLLSAASLLMQLGKWEDAWPLLLRADELQPEVPVILASMSECAVSLGKIVEAKSILQRLLAKQPNHQRNHYQLSRLEAATNDDHVQQMLSILNTENRPPRENIFLNYALGKEFEDLQRWDESFHHYQLAGDAAAEAAEHSVETELQVIDTIIQTCDSEWLDEGTVAPIAKSVPIFIVGLPRTGTTLVERILSSHSSVGTVGETLAIETVLRGGAGRVGAIDPAAIKRAARRNVREIAAAYFDAVDYLLDDRALFVEKYTYNFLYLGFIAKAFPNAKLVHLQRHPMDACFAMYKQPYFSFAFRQDDLAQYYPAYRRLMRHWRSLLGERLVEVSYEALVADAEPRTRELLDALNLPFEPACLEFDKNQAPSATASSVQIRSKIHSRSVGRWQRFEAQLTPLKEALIAQGIEL